MTNTNQVSLGELITMFYDEYMSIYGDEELASIATAASINDILAERGAKATGSIAAEEAA